MRGNQSDPGKVMTLEETEWAEYWAIKELQLEPLSQEVKNNPWKLHERDTPHR